MNNDLLYKIKEKKNSIDFQMTLNRYCNLRCTHCYVSDKDKYKLMSYDIIDKAKDLMIKIISNGNKVGLKEFDIALLGGEIFLIKEMEFFKYLRPVESVAKFLFLILSEQFTMPNFLDNRIVL